ncbi:MAG: hypothetical protein M3490_06305 [Chloroflexota bacterium]|nr:hypothetical protein [Chloroflexota bacterium]
MPNPFDWDYLTTTPASGDVLDAFTILYVVIFLGGFVAAAYLNSRPWSKPFGTMFRRKAVRKASGVAMWVFGVGFFFFLIRLLQINPISFGNPIWMWLSVLAVIVMIGWIAFSWSSARKAAATEAAARTAHTRRGKPLTQQQTKRPVRRTTTLR